MLARRTGRAMARKERIVRFCCHCMGQEDWRARLSVAARNDVRRCTVKDCPFWDCRMGPFEGEADDEDGPGAELEEELEVAATSGVTPEMRRAQIAGARCEDD